MRRVTNRHSCNAYDFAVEIRLEARRHETAVTQYSAGLVPFADALPIRCGEEPGLRGELADRGLELPERCHDCNVRIGGYHHQYCDMERDPVTDAQAIDCERLTVQ